MKKWLLALLWVGLLAAACSPALTATPEPPAATATPKPLTPTAAPTQAATQLSAEQLKNMTYQLLNASSPRSVTLVNGAFTSPDPGDPEYADVHLLEPIAFADLDRDGQADAAVLLAENYGGTGSFVSLLAMLNRAGQPEQGPAAFIEDRPQVNSLSAENGIITLDAVVHAPDDPMCCPTQRKVMTFTLTGAGLTLQTVTSYTPAGDERSIAIEKPVEGAQVAGSVQLSGSFTISPFENTLVYKIYDDSRAELLVAPITVTAEELGGPGTFDIAIDITSIQAGTPIRIEVQETSPADGSILAMDSVNVVVR
jgi:hypothetical protein